MFCFSYSAAIHGLDIRMIKVEADVSDGLPLFHLVGFLGSEVKEARDRVRISLRNAGYSLPAKKITVNLSPADLRKDGSGFDLPIALSILAAYGCLPQESLVHCLAVGEVGLDGKLKPVRGVLPIACAAGEWGFQRCLVPAGNASEGAFAKGIDMIGAESLSDAIRFLKGQLVIPPAQADAGQLLNKENLSCDDDFSDVCGQEAAKRAMEVAAAGMHNLLMLGPPGAGKTMMAKRLPTILPAPDVKEAMEISKIYSISGLLDEHCSFMGRRPFRSPHHTITAAALIGGGLTPKPGELSLSCGGVLFLDELTEFKKSTLELLRQPLEERAVTIARANSVCRYPAAFMLAAAMNPCPCGYYPDAERCRCSRAEVNRYLGRISRPLLDRFDLCIEVAELDYQKLKERREGRTETSRTIRQRVERARQIQKERYQKEGIACNSELGTKLIEKYCALRPAENGFLEEMFKRLQLSVRAYHRILKVARTIADLDGKDEIQRSHLCEAVCYRSLDRKYWGNGND